MPGLRKRLHILHEDMQKEMPGSACCFFNLPGSPASQEMGLTMHTILENPAFFDHKIEGKSVCGWLFDAMNGEVYDLGMNLFSLAGS